MRCACALLLALQGCVHALPRLVYGTAWKKDATAGRATEALRLGFRAFDTANQPKHYNEPGLGEALKLALAPGGGLARSELWIQTKYTPLSGQLEEDTPYDRAAPVAEQVRQSVFGAERGSLAQLGLAYVDSLLLHSPCATAAETLEAWRAMEAAHAAGAARALGVSNFDAGELRALIEHARVPVSVVQNRLQTKTGWDREVRELCAARGIGYQAFGVLTNNRHVLASKEVRAIAGRAAVGAEAVLLRFAAQLNLVVLTGPSSAAHMRADVALLAAPAFSLSTAELAELEGWSSIFDETSPVAATFHHALPGSSRRTAAPVELFWSSGSAAEPLKPQGTLLKEGDEVRVNTVHGHEFVAKDAAGTVLLRWRADAGDGAEQTVQVDGMLHVTFQLADGRHQGADLFWIGAGNVLVPQGSLTAAGKVELATSHGHRFVAKSTVGQTVWAWDWTADADAGSKQVAMVTLRKDEDEDEDERIDEL